jgi:uncharacterized membrane protein YphA (DoxX/SURF4 family)
MDKIINFFAHIARLFAGLVFMFSGIVKGVDPLGFAYKLTDYFHAFHLMSFDGLALPLSFIVCGSEFIIGAALVLNLAPRIFAWFLLAFMAFFTILTFVLALTNPVSDCGCFGDAIKLTNWQTFYKNLILLAPTLLIVFRRKKLGNNSASRNFAFFIISVALYSFISGYSYYYLPIFDFRPYSVGTYLPENMRIPEGMPRDEYEQTLVYQKDSVVKEFTLANYPWQDSTWKWKETRTVLKKKGYQPPIHDFILTDSLGNEFTQDMLADTSFTILLIAHNLEKAAHEGLLKAAPLASLAKHHANIKFAALTASSKEQSTALAKKLGLNYRFGSADETMLKTVIRANPGFVLLHKGTVLGMWSWRNVPSASFFKENTLAHVIKSYHNPIQNGLLIFALIGWLIGVFIIIRFIK